MVEHGHEFDDEERGGRVRIRAFGGCGDRRGKDEMFVGKFVGEEVRWMDGWKEGRVFGGGRGKGVGLCAAGGFSWNSMIDFREGPRIRVRSLGRSWKGVFDVCKRG